MTKSQELVIVSGASSGMRQSAAVELAARGFHVLAGVRTEEDATRVRRENIEPVILDITKQTDIDALGKRVDGDAAGRALRAVVNCAGMGLNGPVEMLPLASWRQMLEVNLLGHIAITQTLLPALRRSRGRLLTSARPAAASQCRHSVPTVQRSSHSKR